MEKLLAIVGSTGLLKLGVLMFFHHHCNDLYTIYRALRNLVRNSEVSPFYIMSSLHSGACLTVYQLSERYRGS